MNKLHVAGPFIAAGLLCAPEAVAQDATMCGPAPALPSTLQSDETVKGQLQGQADFLSKLVGKAELAGQVEAARRQLYQNSDKFFAAQKDAYLAYIFCVLIFQDKKLDTQEKIKALQIFRNPTTPQGSAVPLGMTLLASETKPLDGYHFVGSPELPTGLAAGPILPGGGRTRVVFQAADPDRIIEIDRVGVVINRRDLSRNSTFQYYVDPTRQPGFGAARPRRFNLKLGNGGKTQAFYINDANATKRIELDNILVSTDFPLLRLDRSAGLQETLDFTLVASDPWLYEVYFTAHTTSQGPQESPHF